MKSITLYFILCLLSLTVQSIAQQGDRGIQFNFTINDQPIEIDKAYDLPSIQDSILFETIKCYISNVQFFQNEQLVYASEIKHRLVDAEHPESLNFPGPTDTHLKFNTIKFELGIDSLTNISGAFGGDLDPTNGMYWTWQSGYINFKLEGVTNSCPSRNNRFQFHIGGYQTPFYALQKVELPISDTKSIRINIAIDHFLAQAKLKESWQVMSPNQQAVEMAQLMALSFQVQNEN